MNIFYFCTNRIHKNNELRTCIKTFLTRTINNTPVIFMQMTEEIESLYLNPTEEDDETEPVAETEEVEEDSGPVLTAQKQLLLSNLKRFFENRDYLETMMKIVNGQCRISLRIIDWFVTNYAKKNFIVYDLPDNTRFKVHPHYKLTLRSFQKKNYDPFCRWERIRIPYDDTMEMETTIGQLNFFKWSIENHVIDYIEQHYEEIEQDMNTRNSIAKRKTRDRNTDDVEKSGGNKNATTRKKREELSVSACKCIKKEFVKVTVRFN